MKATMTATPAQALNDLQRPALIRDVAQQLCDIEEDKLKRGDSASWGKATIYVTSYPLIAEELKAAGEKATPQNINKMIRQEYVDDDGAPREGPGSSWLSNALRTGEEFPEVFTAGSKKLPYDAYMQVAVSNLKPADKTWLREEAERRAALPKTDEDHHPR